MNVLRRRCLTLLARKGQSKFHPKYRYCIPFKMMMEPLREEYMAFSC